MPSPRSRGDHGGMARRLRPYLPGVGFHIAARIAFKRSLFNSASVRDAVCDNIASALQCTDARLLAFCVMRNHLHLIVVQGIAPLSRLMKPLMTRTDLHVKKVHGVEGGVFSAPYGAFPCNGADYLRTAIVYTHLNPLRTSLSEDPDSYRWSSQRIYSGLSADSLALNQFVQRDWWLFASNDSGVDSPDGYLEHCNYWRHADVCKAQQIPNEMMRPTAAHGDATFPQRYSGSDTHWGRAPRPDLRDIALRIMEKRYPEVPFDRLQTRSRDRRLGGARKEIAIAASRLGYPGAAIASFLNISGARVSQLTSREQAYAPPTARFNANIRSNGKRVS